MGVKEITQHEWVKVMGYNPSYHQSSADNPVEQVSYKDVQQFVSKLNQLDPNGHYRIPSLWEWYKGCDKANQAGIDGLNGGIQERTTGNYSSSSKMSGRGCSKKNMIPEIDITKTVKAKKLAFGLSDNGLGKARAGWEPRQNP